MFPLMAIGLTFNEVMQTVAIAVAGVITLALLVRMVLLSKSSEIREVGGRDMSFAARKG